MTVGAKRLYTAMSPASNVLSLVIVATALSAASGCTFPTGAQGTWLTATQDTITIGTNTITNYVVASFGTFTLDCLVEYNGRYIARTTTPFSVGGLSLYAYLCMDFTAVTSNLYYYQLGSALQNNVRAVFRTALNAPTEATVCSLATSDYDPREIEVMVKDSDGLSARIACPSDLMSMTWGYEIDSGSGNTCGANTEMNFCTEGQITLNYTACSTPVFYSAGGEVFCLASLTNGSTTFLTVYNNDSTVDGSTTFRMTCLVMEQVGSYMYMTQYPRQCHTGQTPTYVLTSGTYIGASLQLQNSTACTTVADAESIVLYVVVGVVGGLVLITLIGVICFCWCTWKAKQKPFRGRLEPETHDVKLQRLQTFENGFRRHRGPQPNQPESGLQTPPDNDEDTPINVMQLLRKDIITPGGRDSPASHVLLSVTTPNPYSLHDGDSIGGSSLPMENPALKKHYHVIGGEPSVSNLEVEEEDNTPRRQGKTPVMVMPVRPSGNSLVTQDEDDDDDYDDDNNDSNMFDLEGQSSIVAARQGVGISEPMCPASRLPPIDEGPATHRSYTGAGNPSKKTATTTFSQNPTIVEESPRDYEETPRDSPRPQDISRPSSRCETPAPGRRSSLGLIYKMEGNTMVAIPDIADMESGIGAVDEGDKESKMDANVKKGAKLKVSPRYGRRGSLLGSKSADSKKRKTAVHPNKPKTAKPRTPEVTVVDEDEVRMNTQIKMTRVNIPDLLPLHETRCRTPGENELLESPGRYNPAFTMGVGQSYPGADGMADDNPRKLWLNPERPPDDVWGKVSHLWRLGQAWPDKPT